VPAGHSRFAKYEALGNDYLVLDPLDFPEPPDPQLVRRLCDRHRGLGGDGVLWGPIVPVEPFALRLFNPDGSESHNSGNGLRIFARYLWDHGLPAEHDFRISTHSGMVTAHILDAGGRTIAVDMGVLSFRSTDIPAAGPDRELVDEILEAGGQPYTIVGAGIGNPHCVLFLNEISPDLAQRLGPQIENHPLFPERTNVQLARALDRHTLQVEIWERGAGYTLASGTSSCAAAGAAIRTGRCASPVTVKMPGGELRVEVGPDWAARLTGDVEPVCQGECSRALLGG
jgi:diaminopimelate epimerase